MDALKRAPAKGAITVAHVWGDSEAQAFAIVLASVLKEAGWTVAAELASTYSVNAVGLFVVVRTAGTAPPHAAALQQAFNAAGLQLPGATNAKVPEGVVELRVGNKP